MKIEIIEEDGDNTLMFDNEHADFTFDVDPESKTYRSRMSLKDDVYYRRQKYEYRIQTNPIKVETRLIERVDEPPERYCVKDGVVLESDILAERGDFMTPMTKEFIADLNKEVEWHDVWVGDPISMYILSKHPDIISSDDYKRYLRQLSEKIKRANQKAEEFLKADKMGMQITDEYEGSGRTIWYPKSKQDSMSEKEIEEAMEHQHNLQEKLFDEKAPEYVGISEGEFRSSKEILGHIETFLDKNPTPEKKENVQEVSLEKTGKKLILFWFVVGFILGALIF